MDKSPVQHKETKKPNPKPGSQPEMPHERDETAGVTGGIASEQVEKAYVDVKEGRQDTSRGLESDLAYQKQKKAGRPDRS